jgi:lysophospholipid acyltransferase (LPLAT)-like uncharacterized protein
MKLAKRIVSHTVTQGLLAWLAAFYARFVHRTTRWEWRGFESVDRFSAAGEGHILCFWHGRLLMMSCYRRIMLRRDPARGRSMRHAALISQHRDGQLIARAIGHLGIETIAGSSTRGGIEALLACLSALEAGAVLAITPDGPRGPRMRAAVGVLQIARRSGVAVVPAAVSVSRRRLLSSWDRFLLPLPFGRGIFLLGEPLRVSAECDSQALESARVELEHRMNAVTAEADRLMGHAPVEPAPVERLAAAGGVR